MARWAPIAIGLLLLVFGLACFNYTKPDTLQHHQQWAAERGMPAPSNTVLWGGGAAAVIGAFGLGFGVARLRSGRSG